MWDLSCRDWAERLAAGQSLLPELPLDEQRVEQALAVFNALCLPDVPGTPTLGEAAGEWFRDIVRAAFGGFDTVTSERMIREIFCLVPKKNSKTSYSAALMVTALLLNSRPNAEMALIAPTQDIANIAFSQASGMIRADPGLRDKRVTHVQDHLKCITFLPTGSKLKIMSFDPSVLTGQKYVIILFDEPHLAAKMAKAESAFGQLKGGQIVFPESLIIYITTQSDDEPRGVFKAELAKARDIRDGKRTGRMLPILYEFPDKIAKSETAWHDSSIWWMVLPNLGRSFYLDRLIEEFEDSRAKGLPELRRWASQHLNIQIGQVLRADGWPGADYWERRGDPSLTLDTLLERSEVVVAGIDGGGLDDLLGLAVIGRERNTARWLIWTRAWAHRIVLDRRQSEASRLLDLERAGDLILVENFPEDLDGLKSILKEVEDSGLLADVGMDPAGIGSVVDILGQIGIDEDRRHGISQGWALNGSIKTLERKLVDGSARHCGQPLMSWAVGNARQEPRGNAVLITKAASGTGKIDPLMATFNATALMSRNPSPRRTLSIYDVPELWT